MATQATPAPSRSKSSTAARSPLASQRVEFDVPWDVLTVTALDPTSGTIIHAGKKETERFSVHVEQPALQGHTYSFEVFKVFREAQTGTIGFWKNWDSHNKFTRSQIETWLGQIDDALIMVRPTHDERYGVPHQRGQRPGR